MTLTVVETFIIILMVATGTMITRFLPFVLFKTAGANNSYIKYLGEVLPYSAIGLLVVYCLKDIEFTTFSYGIVEAIAIICIVIIHNLKRNTLLSIGVGTIVYMILVQSI
ncbi:MAG: branched-chain amino acid transporter AzlD [Clostridiales bacterium]|nr:branched-chain amino acid transporter AzlD [Clostridiales bacterium]